MSIILYNITDKTLKLYKESNVLDDIYFQKARVPNKKQVSKYLLPFASGKDLKLRPPP